MLWLSILKLPPQTRYGTRGLAISPIRVYIDSIFLQVGKHVRGTAGIVTSHFTNRHWTDFDGAGCCDN